MLAANPFHLGEVDFFHAYMQLNEDKGPDIKIEANRWVEPMMMPDGQFEFYMPPLEVVEFLENPTEDSAKSYLR